MFEKCVISSTTFPEIHCCGQGRCFTEKAQFGVRSPNCWRQRGVYVTWSFGSRLQGIYDVDSDSIWRPRVRIRFPSSEGVCTWRWTRNSGEAGEACFKFRGTVLSTSRTNSCCSLKPTQNVAILRDLSISAGKYWIFIVSDPSERNLFIFSYVLDVFSRQTSILFLFWCISYCNMTERRSYCACPFAPLICGTLGHANQIYICPRRMPPSPHRSPRLTGCCRLWFY